MLRTHNKGELCGGEFEHFCKQHGITLKNTIPYTPQHNGVSEILNRVLIEKARNMLTGASITQEFWEEAVDMVCYLVNRSLSKDLVDKTPYEAWTNKKPSLAHLRVFGCEACLHVPKEKKANSTASQRNASSLGTRMESKDISYVLQLQGR